MTTYTHIQSRGSRRRTTLLLSLAALLIGVGSGDATPSSKAAGKAAQAGGYFWPVKPFHRPHPVRGNFGDPRTRFYAPPTMRGLLNGNGDFHVHHGIDISAPDGTAVYPVASGTVTYADEHRLTVDSGNGRAFEYWHIRPRVGVGSHVEAYRTVLGPIMRSAAHVHLTEVVNGSPVNPLAPGHLTPYDDRTTPRVTSITFRRSETSRDLLPDHLRGRVLMVGAAEDMPTIAVPGSRGGLPVTPALVTWEIRTWDGRVVVPREIAVDFRRHMPPAAFWSVYARGTYQNVARFGNHKAYAQPGSYLFKLTAGRFDTRRLRDGAYNLVVTATDSHGNSSSLARRFAVYNHR